jgi:glycosyltransferase involved in cell wall biosynthesis
MMTSAQNEEPAAKGNQTAAALVADLKVSIVTVSLNAMATIADTLASVAGQRAGVGIEHICIDGGSHDGTRELLAAYAEDHPGVQCLFEPDIGLFDAMNKGLRLARGRYVLFLNADDFLASPTAIATAFTGIGAASAPDMVLGSVVMGRLDEWGLWRMRTSPRLLQVFARSGAHPPHHGTFIKTELLAAIGGFDAAARAASDTATFYKVVRRLPRPSLHITPTVISFMRAGGASNAGLQEHLRGNVETFRILRKTVSVPTALFCTAVKMMQKLFEFRLGRLASAQWRWFSP